MLAQSPRYVPGQGWGEPRGLSSGLVRGRGAPSLCAKGTLGSGQCGSGFGVKPVLPGVRTGAVHRWACSLPPSSPVPPCLLSVGVLSAGTDLRPGSCLSLISWALPAPVSAPCKTPTPASDHLTPLCSPGPLRRPDLSPGGSAPTAAPRLIGTSALLPLPCGPMTPHLEQLRRTRVPHFGQLGGGGGELPLE